MSAADIFGKYADKIFTLYAAELTFKNLVVGGIPSDRSVIESWIRSRMELNDAAITELVEQTAQERGVMSPDEAVEIVLESDLAPSINGFKRNENGELCLEGRTIKAGLKEWANSAYPGTQFPGKSKIAAQTNKKGEESSPLRKGLMRYLAETVIVPEILIGLGVKEPSWVEERIKHVTTAQGPRSSINRVEVVERASIAFTVKVRDDFLPQEAWARIWSTGEAIGLGSDRGRSDGQFDLIRWEKIK